jgi:hypothetical protein
MDRLQSLRELFANAEGNRYTVEFGDGDSRDLLIVSATHVSLDDTVVGVPLAAGGSQMASEPGVQFSLQDVRRVLDFDTRRLLFGTPDTR